MDDNGFIETIMSLPEEAVEANLQPGQACFEVKEDVVIDPDTQKVGPDDTLVQYEKPYDFEQGFAKIRVERNTRLAACDWTQVQDAPVDAQVWATYRQALRDLPDGLTDPRDVVWPEPPV
ncbi:tail fiber assembly protein [Roseicyclus sp.]|uniref:tail fiber assembly protein n=1 Tax=Roseicyclus sp. TaxID=1914329 RepID=UPI003F6B8B59